MVTPRLSLASDAGRRDALRRLGQGAGVGVLASALAACGFRLRQPPRFNFHTILVEGPAGNGALAAELRRTLGTVDGLTVLGGTPAPAVTPAAAAPSAPALPAQVRLELLEELRQKVVVGVSAAGQVREFQLRLRLRVRARSARGTELLPDTELLQQRDFSFNESLALAKEAEEVLLYREMQSDLVQQLLRRLATLVPD